MTKEYECADGTVIEIPSTAEFGHEVYAAPDLMVGAEVKVGHHSKLHRGVVLHDGCSIGAFSQIHGGTKVQDDASLGDNVVTGTKCFVGKSADIANGCRFGDKVKIGEGTILEPRVTVWDKVKIGKNCHVGFGALVMRDLDDGEVVPKHQVVYTILGARETAWKHCRL